MKIPLTESLAQELYVASDKYDIADLKEERINFLQLSIKAENAISLLSWSDKYQFTGIKEHCFAFAVEKGSEIFLYNVAGWRELGQCSLKLRQSLIKSIVNKVSDAVNFSL